MALEPKWGGRQRSTKNLENTLHLSTTDLVKTPFKFRINPLLSKTMVYLLAFFLMLNINNEYVIMDSEVEQSVSITC